MKGTLTPRPDSRGRRGRPPPSTAAGVARLPADVWPARGSRVDFVTVMFSLLFEANPARRMYEELGWLFF